MFAMFIASLMSLLYYLTLSTNNDRAIRTDSLLATIRFVSTLEISNRTTLNILVEFVIMHNIFDNEVVIQFVDHIYLLGKLLTFM